MGIDLKTLGRRWKTVDDMSHILKDRMVDEAKKSALARYFLRFGFRIEKDFYVDELRRFVKYCEYRYT